MGEVVCDVSVSADGYVAGANQTRDKPFGDGPVERLHAWMFETPEENKAEVDRIVAAGAFVMGRNMFGPVRGEWDLGWAGWWGDEPPYHGPVFVLTHHARQPLTAPRADRSPGGYDVTGWRAGKSTSSPDSMAKIAPTTTVSPDDNTTIAPVERARTRAPSMTALMSSATSCQV